MKLFFSKNNFNTLTTDELIEGHRFAILAMFKRGWKVAGQVFWNLQSFPLKWQIIELLVVLSQYCTAIKTHPLQVTQREINQKHRKIKRLLQVHGVKLFLLKTLLGLLKLYFFEQSQLTYCHYISFLSCVTLLMLSFVTILVVTFCHHLIFLVL